MFIPIIKSIYQKYQKKNNEDKKIEEVKKKLKTFLLSQEKKELFLVVASIKLVTGEEIITFYSPVDSDKILISAPMVIEKIGYTLIEGKIKNVTNIIPWSFVAFLDERYINLDDVVSIVVLEGPRSSLSQIEFVNLYKMKVREIVKEEAKKTDKYMNKHYNLLKDKLKLEKIYYDSNDEKRKN